MPATAPFRTSRRALAKGAAWGVPIVVVAGAAPQVAASSCVSCSQAVANNYLSPLSGSSTSNAVTISTTRCINSAFVVTMTFADNSTHIITSTVSGTTYSPADMKAKVVAARVPSLASSVTITAEKPFTFTVSCATAALAAASGPATAAAPSPAAKLAPATAPKPATAPLAPAAPATPTG